MTGQQVHTAGLLVLSAAILINLFTGAAQNWEPLLWPMMTISVLLMVVGFVMRRRERRQVDVVRVPS